MTHPTPIATGDTVNDRPILLDLFCCAGGCTRGYQMAGFRVVGVDDKRQPRYVGDAFVQADALEYVAAHGHLYDAIHASPPCQRFSKQTPMECRHSHPDLIAPIRDLLLATGKPFVIENVENARMHLHNPVMLCGSMFGLNLWRHRYFETHPLWLMSPASCNHAELPVLITGTTRWKIGGETLRFEYTAQQCRDASGLHWMTRKEMDEAIPPAFTEWIGQHLMQHIGVTA